MTFFNHILLFTDGKDEEPIVCSLLATLFWNVLVVLTLLEVKSSFTSRHLTIYLMAGTSGFGRNLIIMIRKR